MDICNRHAVLCEKGWIIDQIVLDREFRYLLIKYQTFGRSDRSGGFGVGRFSGKMYSNKKSRAGRVRFIDMASKDEIIAAASRLFVEKGFENTTMQDIAETVGIYKGSLYHHIRSKADLFYEILDMSMKESSKSMRKVRKSDLEPEEKFRKIILVHYENILNFSLEYQILLNERRHMLNEKQEKRIRFQMKGYENNIFEVLKEAISAKVFRDDLNPRVIVAGIMAAGNGIYKWYSPTGLLTFQEIASTYVELFVHGLKNSNR